MDRLDEVRDTRLRRALDVLLLAAVFAAFAAGPPPDVNEAHYLTKARQFWRPDWLPGDLFLTSSFPHWLFYASLGSLAAICEFETAAWIGRAVGWLLLAIGWEGLAESVGLKRIGKLIGAIVWIGFTTIGNLSGEWVVGGIEAKVPAYAFVLWSLSQAVQGRWGRAWIAIGVSTAFHVLVGGWSFVVAWLVRWSSRREYRVSYREVACGVLGLAVGAALGGWPGLAADWGADGPTRALAAHVQVRERIAHHLYFWDFSRWNIVGFGLTVLLWREFSRRANTQTRWIARFGLASLLPAIGGLVLSCLANVPELGSVAEGLLRLYWFRLPDAAIPLALAIAVAVELGPAWRKPRTSFKRRCFAATAIAVAAAAISVGSVVERWQDGRPGADRQSLPTYDGDSLRTRQTCQNWIRACRWIAAHTPRSALFLTPRQQQSFAWYSGRAEYVNWKNVPQDATRIATWRERMGLAYGSAWDSSGLWLVERNAWPAWLAGRGIHYVVIEQAVWHELQASGPTEPLRQIYPEQAESRSTYVVLEVALRSTPSPALSGGPWTTKCR